MSSWLFMLFMDTVEKEVKVGIGKGSRIGE